MVLAALSLALPASASSQPVSSPAGNCCRGVYNYVTDTFVCNEEGCPAGHCVQLGSTNPVTGVQKRYCVCDSTGCTDSYACLTTVYNYPDGSWDLDCDAIDCEFCVISFWQPNPNWIFCSCGN